MTGSQPLRRLAVAVVASALVLGLTSPAAAAPKNPTTPAATAHQRRTNTDADRLADSGVREVYTQWRTGKYKPTKGVGSGSLRVQISHRKGQDITSLVRRLGAANVREVTPTVVVADVPFDKLSTLQDDAKVSALTLPTTVNALPVDPVDVTNAVGPKGTNGGDILAKTNAKVWQERGFSGAGVKIGVIDFFDNKDASSDQYPDSTPAYWSRALAAGEIKPAAGTFCRQNGADCDIWTGQSEHGVAVVEILNDMAPDAQVYLATAVTLADMHDAIDWFAANGVKIITRSLTGAFDGPGDGTGPSAELVTYAASRGIAWFNSAGNSGRQGTLSGGSVGGYWRQTWTDTDGDGWLNFHDPAGVSADSELLPVKCSSGVFFNGLRWNDWGESDRSDYDLFAFASASANPSSSTILASSTSDQTTGADPVEGVYGDSAAEGNFSFITCPSGGYFYVGIYRYDAGNPSDGPDILEIMVNGQLGKFASSPGSAGQPISDSKSTSMASIGAVDPVAGTAIGSYSSQGPLNDGRTKPDLSAGAGMTSYTYTKFSGTSASAPVAAGAAALILDSDPSLTAPQLISYLKQSAIVDRGATGADNVYGTGELRLADYPLATTSKPTISGTPKVGNTLTASVTPWAPAPVTMSYQWYASGQAIAGATKATLTLAGAQAGKTITVRATGSKVGYTPSILESAATAKVAPGTLKTALPAITGTRKIGATLTANPGTWTSGTRFAYQWLRDGVAIAKATSKTYSLVGADYGRQVSVKVTGYQLGYTAVPRTSSPVYGFAVGKLTTKTPTITGTLTRGKTVTAKPGSWTSGTAFTYQWYANGKAIKGATAATLKLTKAQEGKKLSVKVTGKQNGYTKASKTSKQTAKVLKATTPKITGTRKVGKTLKVTKGSWATKVKFSYRWYRDGEAISGATKSTYKLKAADKGTKITVKLTGKRSGYATVALTSAATATVK